MADKMVNRPIIERCYYAVSLSLASPLCIRSGDNSHTDMDVMKNREGEVFIPGTTFAGAFRERLHMGKEEDSSFGYTKGKEGHMSSVFISDLYFANNPNVSLRDGVSLNPDKSVDNKFDGEIIETGAKGILFLNYIRREGDTWDCSLEIRDMLKALDSGEIRIGAKKNRGYGRLTIDGIGEKSFMSGDRSNWVDFVPRRKELDQYNKLESFNAWLEKKNFEYKNEYITVTVHLRLTGGLSIRRYSTQPGKADYEQLTCNEKPVIPGSSWNGAIRSDAVRILRELDCPSITEKMKTWFGYVDVNTQKAQQSMVAIEESSLGGNYSFVPITRNQVSRFSAATVPGALYTEIMVAQGTTDLIIRVRKNEEKNYKALIGLLLLVAEDIKTGMLPIGGLVAVGRGVFAGQDGKATEISGGVTEVECNKALFEIVTGGKKE